MTQIRIARERKRALELGGACVGVKREGSGCQRHSARRQSVDELHGAGQFERVSAGSTTYGSGALGLTRENLDGYIRDDAGLLLFRRTLGRGDHFYLLDGLGSVVGLTNSLGDLVATYSYEPFGKLKSSTGTVANPYRWLGGLGVYHDTATGLYKMGTRYYDPSIGRFTQVDPVVGGSANAYDHAGQDPVNNLDLDGARCLCRSVVTDAIVSVAKNLRKTAKKRLENLGLALRYTHHALLLGGAASAMAFGCSLAVAATRGLRTAAILAFCTPPILAASAIVAYAGYKAGKYYEKAFSP